MAKRTAVKREPVKFFSLYANSGARVDRDKRTIFGVAVATKGAANSDTFDNETLKMLCTLGNNGSIRARFDHPEQGWTGQVEQSLEKFLGQHTNFRVEGDTLRADCVMAGVNIGLEDKILSLAERAPSLFGLSVVFNDKSKKKGQPCRPTDFLAADFVDLPAANSAGLFSKKPSDDGDEDMDETDVYAKDGKLFCMIDGKEFALRHTAESVDNLMNAEKEKKKAAKEGEGGEDEETKEKAKKMALESETAMTPQEIQQMKADAKKEAIEEEKTYAKMFGTVLSTTGLTGEDAEKFKEQFYDRHASEADLKFFAQSVVRNRATPAGEGSGNAEEKKVVDEDPDKDIIEECTKRFSMDSTFRGNFKVSSSSPDADDYKRGLASYIRLAKKNRSDKTTVLASKRLNTDDDIISKALKKNGVLVK